MRGIDPKRVRCTPARAGPEPLSTVALWRDQIPRQAADRSPPGPSAPIGVRSRDRKRWLFSDLVRPCPQPISWTSWLVTADLSGLPSMAAWASFLVGAAVALRRPRSAPENNTGGNAKHANDGRQGERGPRPFGGVVALGESVLADGGLPRLPEAWLRTLSTGQACLAGDGTLGSARVTFLAPSFDTERPSPPRGSATDRNGAPRTGLPPGRGLGRQLGSERVPLGFRGRFDFGVVVCGHDQTHHSLALPEDQPLLLESADDLREPVGRVVLETVRA